MLGRDNTHTHIHKHVHTHERIETFSQTILGKSKRIKKKPHKTVAEEEEEGCLRMKRSYSEKDKE